MIDIIENLRKKELTDDLHSVEGFTFFSSLWLLQDKDLLKLIEYVKNNEAKVEQKFIEQFRYESESRLDFINSKFKEFKLTNEQYNDLESFYKIEISTLSQKIKINTISEYSKQFKKNNFQNYYKIGERSITLKLIYAQAFSYEHLMDNSVYLYVCECLFNKYKRDYSRENFDYRDLLVSDKTKAELNRIYGESALCKYNLFKINLTNHHIQNDEIPYIFDENNQTDYLMLDYKKKRVFEIFKDLINQGYIKDISFQILSVDDCLLGQEEFKYGHKFSLDLKNLPDVTVFYDLKNQDDNLWISIRKDHNNKFSVTFEETIDDWFYDKNDRVITNLIHLEITEKNGIDVISHIDHEYIIYEMETYILRLDDSSIKGENKIKTFKIDNSEIPLNYKYHKSNVLFHIVNECMEKKELIKEYFEDLV